MRRWPGGLRRARGACFGFSVPLKLICQIRLVQRSASKSQKYRRHFGKCTHDHSASPPNLPTPPFHIHSSRPNSDRTACSEWSEKAARREPSRMTLEEFGGMAARLTSASSSLTMRGPYNSSTCAMRSFNSSSISACGPSQAPARDL